MRPPGFQEKAFVNQSTKALQESLDGDRVVAVVVIYQGGLDLRQARALGRCLDEMPPQTRRLLALLEKMTAAACAARKIERGDFLFSRRSVREFTGWGDTQLKVHLGRLVELEYVLAHRADHGQGNVYELVYDGQGKDGRRFLSGLLDVEKLRRAHDYDARRSGVNGERSGGGRWQPTALGRRFLNDLQGEFLPN